MNSTHIHIIESVTISERYIALVQCYEPMYNACFIVLVSTYRVVEAELLQVCQV